HGGQASRTIDATADERGLLRLDDVFNQAPRAPTQPIRIELTLEERNRRLGKRLVLDAGKNADVEQVIGLEPLGRVTLRLVDRVTGQGIHGARVVIYRHTSDPFGQTSITI